MNALDLRREDPYEFPPLAWGDSASAQLLIEWLTSDEALALTTNVLTWHLTTPVAARCAARNVLTNLHDHINEAKESA